MNLSNEIYGRLSIVCFPIKIFLRKIYPSSFLFCIRYKTWSSVFLKVPKYILHYTSYNSPCSKQAIPKLELRPQSIYGLIGGTVAPYSQSKSETLNFSTESRGRFALRMSSSVSFYTMFFRPSNQSMDTLWSQLKPSFISKNRHRPFY